MLPCFHQKVSGESGMMAEIFARGPIACEVDADPLDDYTGGVLTNVSEKSTNHIVSIVGWGVDAATGLKYWDMRNSWGEYWGESGYARVERGVNLLGLESKCSWATLEGFTAPGQNKPCDEDGANCGNSSSSSSSSPAVLAGGAFDDEPGESPEEAAGGSARGGASLVTGPAIARGGETPSGDGHRAVAYGVEDPASRGKEVARRRVLSRRL
mmetsp:Transcript_40935/g.92142  ORF Transcript_40935/g.92142 Transcript_40935/m.92142 type:complete len:212 (+) Transcript_40935:820-1455(+)